jgi:hypothetical protein
MFATVPDDGHLPHVGKEKRIMIGIDRLMRGAVALALLLAFAPIPAKAQLGGNGDMMQQMAPMLEMMKARMGKRRFAKLMQTMGPMMSGMMENGGLGGMMSGGGFGGFGAPGFGAAGFGNPDTATSGFESQGSGQEFASGSPAGFGGFGAGGMGGFDAGQMMAMIPQLVSLADMGGGSRHHHRKKRRHHRSAP